MKILTVMLMLVSLAGCGDSSQSSQVSDMDSYQLICIQGHLYARWPYNAVPLFNDEGKPKKCSEHR